MNPILSSVMDLELTQTMNGSLDYFLTSLRGGNEALTSFLQDWMSMNETLRSHQDNLKEETLTEAHNLASTIGSIAAVMLELETHKDLMHRQLAADFSHILNDDMENLVIRDEFPVSPGPSSAPSYIKPCSQWLLANLYNPYPAKSVRNSICKQTGSSIKDLDAWFTDARKRIGWNQLRRTHFSNRREKIIDAATRFFKPSQEFLKLGPSSQAFISEKLEDHSMAFVEMEERAQRLFSDKFDPTPLARTLDHEVQDLPPLSQTQNQPSQPGLQIQQIKSTLKRKRSAYPSPERSPERSPELLPELLAPTTIASASPIPLSTTISHKRRRSSQASSDDISLDQPQKRLRSTSAQNFDIALAAASLPSPAASLNEVSSPVGNDLLQLSPTMCPAALLVPTIQLSTLSHSVPPTKRKRCFSHSEAEDQRPSKYLQPAPLSRVASNPLPMPNDLLHKSPMDDLLQDYLLNRPFFHEIPSSTFDEILDESIPVDVNYYQYSLSPVILDNDLQLQLTPHDVTSVPLQGINSSPSFELNTWVEGLQGSNLHDFLDAESPIYTVEQNSLLLEPDYFKFSELPTLAVPSISTSSTSDWMTLAIQPINFNSTSAVEAGAVLNQTSLIPILGHQPTMIERAAKRKRAEILRAELQLLEADIE